MHRESCRGERDATASARLGRLTTLISRAGRYVETVVTGWSRRAKSERKVPVSSAARQPATPHRPIAHVDRGPRVAPRAWVVGPGASGITECLDLRSRRRRSDSGLRAHGATGSGSRIDRMACWKSLPTRGWLREPIDWRRRHPECVVLGAGLVGNDRRCLGLLGQRRRWPRSRHGTKQQLRARKCRLHLLVGPGTAWSSVAALRHPIGTVRLAVQCIACRRGPEPELSRVLRLWS